MKVLQWFRRLGRSVEEVAPEAAVIQTAGTGAPHPSAAGAPAGAGEVEEAERSSFEGEER